MDIYSKKLRELQEQNKIAVLNNYETDCQGHRFLYPELMSYAEHWKKGKVYALIGLRRTGKTTEMLQCAKELFDKNVKVLFLSLAQPYESDIEKNRENLVQISDIYEILRDAKAAGIEVVFIDEITYVNDFIIGNNLANVYAREFPIIIAGTDSLGMKFAQENALLDRMIVQNTSYVSFEEYSSLFTEKNLDDYIRFGGTLHDESPYKNFQDATSYMNSSIAGNITHSLRFAEEESPYPLLSELYKDSEIISAIQKIANKAGQDITIRALTREYESNPIRQTFANVSRGVSEPEFDRALAKKSETLKKIEMELKDYFEIKWNRELKHPIQNDHFEQLKAYLYDIGLLKLVPVYESLDNSKTSKLKYREILLQPGMLYCHALQAIKVLENNLSSFEEWHIHDKPAFINRLDRQIKGDILEGIILYDTYKAFIPEGTMESVVTPYVSKIRLENILWKNASLNNVEADVIIRNPENKKIHLLEVKYSGDKYADHEKNLRNEMFLSYLEENFSGSIGERVVIYTGENDFSGDVKYVNAEDYLKNIRKTKSLEECLSIIAEKEKSIPIKEQCH